MDKLDKKLKYMDGIYLYKYQLYDRINHKVKVYFISPDNHHKYISIDSVYNKKNICIFELGDLLLNSKKNLVFEDTPDEIFELNKNDFKLFNEYFKSKPLWYNANIGKFDKLYDNREEIC